MNVKLNEILYDNWLKINTWHTGHPSNEKRFHLAIKEVYTELGYILYEDIFEEIKDNINSTSWNNEYISYAKKASCSLEYLNDIHT